MLKPGDLIKFVYAINKTDIMMGEELYSTTMKRWICLPWSNQVPVLLVALYDNQYVWLSEKGLFSAKLTDISESTNDSESGRVNIVPINVDLRVSRKL